MWNVFWDGLNIRKLMAVLIVSSYVAYIFWTGQDMGIKDVALIIISYFFGYANGQQQPRETPSGAGQGSAEAQQVGGEMPVQVNGFKPGEDK